MIADRRAEQNATDADVNDFLLPRKMARSVHVTRDMQSSRGRCGCPISQLRHAQFKSLRHRHSIRYVHISVDLLISEVLGTFSVNTSLVNISETCRMINIHCALWLLPETSLISNLNSPVNVDESPTQKVNEKGLLPAMQSHQYFAHGDKARWSNVSNSGG